MELRKDFRNELLKRREIHGVLQSEKNPGLGEVRKLVAGKFKVGEDAVALKFVKNNFGSNEFLVEAFVYDSAEDLLNTEQVKKVKKKVGV